MKIDDCYLYAVCEMVDEMIGGEPFPTRDDICVVYLDLESAQRAQKALTAIGREDIFTECDDYRVWKYKVDFSKGTWA